MSWLEDNAGPHHVHGCLFALGDECILMYIFTQYSTECLLISHIVEFFNVIFGQYYQIMSCIYQLYWFFGISNIIVGIDSFIGNLYTLKSLS